MMPSVGIDEEDRLDREAAGQVLRRASASTGASSPATRPS